MLKVRTNNILIATMPKSGTWYCICFFLSYASQLPRRFLNIFRKKPTLHELLVKHPTPHIIDFKKGGHPVRLQICHSICPGYKASLDPLYAAWDQLRFSTEGYHQGQAIFDELDPENNPASRIIYLYRNPLDQFISFYRHALHHIDESHRMVKEGAEVRPLRDIQDYIFNSSCLDSYIKQYHTFQVMAERYPQQVLLLPYETLTRDPENTFTLILKHAQLFSPKKEKALKTALLMSSKEAVKAAEKQLGRALANDQQTNANETHIRDGKKGMWKDHLSEEDLRNIEKRFNQFNLSLKQFEIE